MIEWVGLGGMIAVNIVGWIVMSSHNNRQELQRHTASETAISTRLITLEASILEAPCRRDLNYMVHLGEMSANIQSIDNRLKRMEGSINSHHN